MKQRVGRGGMLAVVAFLVSACGSASVAGTGTMPSVEGIHCEFTTVDPAPGEYAPPPIAAVIEWGGYEAYGGRWHEPRVGRIVEGSPPTPLVVGIVGDAAAFEEWLDFEPARREISGIDRVVRADVPYCLLEDAYLRLPLIPGFVAGGITVVDDRQVIEVNVDDLKGIDLSDYPPFMVFSEETITFSSGGENLADVEGLGLLNPP